MKKKFLKVFQLLTILFVVFATVLGYQGDPSAPVFRKGPDTVAIVKATVEEGGNASSYPGAVCDGDVNTYWQPAAEAPEGKIALQFEEPQLLYSLTLAAELGSSSAVRIEYEDEGIWVTAPCAPIVGDGVFKEHSLNLSPLRIVTGKILLVVPGGDKIYDLSVCGIPAGEVYHRLVPETVETAVPDNAYSSVANLFDNNTYTIWQSGNGRLGPDDPGCVLPRHPWKRIREKHGMDRNTICMTYPEGTRLEEVRFMPVANENAGIRIEARNGDDKGVRLYDSYGRLREDWYIVSGHEAGNIRQIKVTLDSHARKEAGLREFECWGYGAYEGRKYLPLGETLPRLLSSPETFFFQNTEDDDSVLWIIILGERTDALSVLINTVSYTIAPLKNTDGSTLYRIKLRPGIGDSGEQTLMILPPEGQPAMLYGVWLASGDADGEQEEDLYRSLVTTALSGKQESLFSERLLLEDMETTGRGVGFLTPEGFVNGVWTPLERFDEGALWSRYRLPNGSEGRLGGVRFSGGIIQDNLEGIRVLGSIYSDHAPVVRILKPAAGEEIGGWESHGFDYYIVGYTDKADAMVTVNGKRAIQFGHYFWQPIVGPELLRDGSLVITALARDREGREGRDEITVSLADFLFTVNLAEGVTWTNTMSIEVKGRVKTPHVEMEVNGKKVPVIGNSYATTVPLSAGMNIILIYGKDKRSGKERTATRRVYCSQEGVILEIENPQNGSYLGAENCIVSGRVSGPDNLRVTVNGVQATVTGSFYRSGAVNLAEGANTISVKAYNRETKLAEKSITVYRDTLKPIISSIVPEENSLLNQVDVSVSVTVSDASPVWVFVNGKQAMPEGNAYGAVIPLADGSQEIKVFAEDRAGNRTTALRHVTVDTTPPLPFTVTITPEGWTNVKQPVVTFATSDATSGIDHYELSLDNGPYQIVTSPYQLPELADGMHKIRVKAIDRAGWERLAEAEAWIDTTPPETPADFKVVPGNAKAILSYTAVSSDTTGFKIERVPLWSETETVKKVSGLTWVDEGLENGGVYCYRLQAVDHAGNMSPFSEWITIESGVEVEVYNPQTDTIAEFDGATLTIPAEGLFPETATVRIREVESEVLTEAQAFPGTSPVFEFEAVDSAGAPVKSGESLPKPYLGAIRYEENLIPEGLTEDDLDVYYFDTMWGRWLRCDSLVDKNANVVYFTSNHFSFYEVQATAVKDLTPDEIKKSGYSPFRTYMEHGSFDVAPDNGSLTNRVTELVLPGPSGFDLTIARTYTTAQAKADAFVVVNAILAPYVAEKANFAFTVGKGIRLDLPYIKNTGDNKYIVLPGGGGYSFYEMDLDTSKLKTIESTYTETYWVSGWYIWGYDSEGNYVPVDYHAGYYSTRTVPYSYKEGSIVMTPHGSKDFELSVGMVIGKKRIVTLSDGSKIAFRNSYTTGLEIDSFPETNRPHYRLLMNDGTEYFFDSEGRPIRITDPTGLHSINIFYKNVNIGTGKFSGIDFIQDAVGRKVYFDYTAIGGLPYISKIRVNDDGAYQRVITYTHDSRGYLTQEIDAGGRRWEYQYVDFSVPAKQTLIPFNFYKYIESRGNTLLLDIILKQYQNAPMQFRNCPLLKELRGPGKGIIRAEYGQFVESDSGFTVVSDIKVFVDEESYSKGRPQRWTSYEYHADSYTVIPAGINIPADKRGYIKRTTANDCNRVTEYYFEAFLQKNARWVIKDYDVQTDKNIIKEEMGEHLYSVSARRVKIERKDIMAEEPVREVVEFIYKTPATEAGKASARPDAKKTSRGMDWAQTSYAYDDYGNIIKEETEMHSSGRTNKTIAYRAYNTNPDIWNSQEGFKPYSSAGSPGFSVPEFNRVRRNLLLREMVANYTPTFTNGVLSGEIINYQYNYYQYNILGQVEKTAVWDSSASVWQIATISYYLTIPLTAKCGLVRQITDPLNQVVEYDYDAQGYLSRKTVKAVKDADGNTTDVTEYYGYDPKSGWLLWTRNARGYVTEYSYDRLGRVTEITYPADNESPGYTPLTGRPTNPKTHISYDDTPGKLSATEIDPEGAQTRYEFDDFGQLVKVVKFKRRNGVYEEYSTTTLSYNRWGETASMTDPNGNKTAYNYDAMGRMSEIKFPDGTLRKFDYDYKTNTLTMTDENGHRRSEVYDMAGRVIESTAWNNGEAIKMTYYYDGMGNTVASFGPRAGKETYQTYDSRNLVISTVLAQGTFFENGSMVEARPETRYEYDGNGRLVTTTVITGTGTIRETITRYDGLGRAIVTEVRSRSLQTDPLLAPSIISKRYYDPNGNVIKESDPSYVLPPAQGRTNLTPTYVSYAYSPRDKMVAMTDRGGNRTTYVYNKDGTLASLTSPRGNSGRYGDASLFTIRYYYDDLKRLVRAELPSKRTGESRPVVSFEYDARGNLIRRMQPDGGSMEYTYTMRNSVATETISGSGTSYTTEFYYDKAGNLIRVRDARGFDSLREYDDLNRLIRVTSPEGSVESYEYDEDGNRTAVIRSDGTNELRTEQDYDLFGRVTELRTPLSGRDGYLPYRYFYDRLGNLTKSVDSLGNERTAIYDEFGRLAEEHVEEGGVYRFTYHAWGGIATSTDPNGTTATYTYTANQQIQSLNMDNGTRSHRMLYDYDEEGFLKQAIDMVANQGPAVVSLYNRDQNGVYVPDPYDRLVAETTRIGSVDAAGNFTGVVKNLTISYSYDIMDRLTNIVYPNGRGVSYSYNQLGQVTGMPGYLAAPPIYGAGGLLTSVMAANGVTTEYDYDADGRLKSLSHRGPKGEVIKGYTYTYDKMGNIVQKNDDRYVYDEESRLVAAFLRGSFSTGAGASGEAGRLPVLAAEEDVLGERQMEAVVDTAEVELDYHAKSIGVDLGDDYAVKKIELVPQIIEGKLIRVKPETVRVFVSDTNGPNTYLEVGKGLFKAEQDEKWIVRISFHQPLMTRYVKIKTDFNELELLSFKPVNKSSFKNRADSIIRVSYNDNARRREEHYRYDALGNRLEERVTVRQTDTKHYFYYPKTSRLMTDGKWAYVYDANGNMVGKSDTILIGGKAIKVKDVESLYWEDFAGTSTQGLLLTAQGSGTYYVYEYDLMNRMIRVLKNGKVIANYSYNWKGLRVKKEKPDAKDGEVRTTYYSYSPNGKILYEEEVIQGASTVGTNEFRQYVYLFGRHFAREDGTISATGEVVVTKKVFYQTDHLGSTVAVTDTSGELVWSNEFTPFGSLADAKERPEAGAKFTGKDYDEDASLYYFNARWYDSETGRFTSLDPIRDGLNWYVYCSNNPVNFVDPMGLVPKINNLYDLFNAGGSIINDDDQDNNNDSGSSGGPAGGAVNIDDGGTEDSSDNSDEKEIKDYTELLKGLIEEYGESEGQQAWRNLLYIPDGTQIERLCGGGGEEEGGEYKRLLKILKDIIATDKVDGSRLYLRSYEEGCFFRAYLIGEYLEKEGFRVDYGVVHYPLNPKGDRFVIHIAPIVTLNDGTRTVIDPLWSSRPLTEEQWLDRQYNTEEEAEAFSNFERLHYLPFLTDLPEKGEYKYEIPIFKFTICYTSYKELAEKFLEEFDKRMQEYKKNK